MTAILGLLLYLLVFRPLRAAPPVARVVASVGVQIVIVLLITKEPGTVQVPVAQIFQNSTFKLGGSTMETNRFWLAGTIIVLGLLLGALFRYTRFGLATRAAAESEKGAAVSRISANRVAALNWMLSSAVAAFGGILIAPIVSVVPIAYSLFIVPALAAAVLSRFESLVAAIVGGLFIGMLQSEATFLKSDFSWFPSRSGGPELVPLVLILIFLVARGKPLPARGALIQRTLGRAPRPRHLRETTVVGVAAGSLMLLLLPKGEWRTAFILSLVLGIIGLALTVVVGPARSHSPRSRSPVHRRTCSRTSRGHGRPVPARAGAVCPGHCGDRYLDRAPGAPGARPHGGRRHTGPRSSSRRRLVPQHRHRGLRGRPRRSQARVFGFDVSMGSVRNTTHLTFGFVALITLTMVGLGVALLRRSRFGSAMAAIRANECSAAAAGVDVVRMKLLAFAIAIASFIAGLGGAMTAYYYGAISYSQFLPLVGLALFATTYLAGITSVSGGIAAGMIGLGGLTYTATTKLFNLGGSASLSYQLITAILLILTVINNPEGIMGTNHKLADKLNAWLRQRRSAKAGVAPADGHPPMRVSPGIGAGYQPVESSVPVLLSIRGLRVAYGGVVAVDDVTFHIRQGAIIGLIGPNGAGKTTLVDAVSGFAEHTGTVEFDGHNLTGRKPHERVKLGLSRTFQAIELYEDLSVEENLAVGLSSGRQGFGAAARRSLDDTCAVLGIEELRDKPAGDLSQGQRQLVSIGRALVAQPKLLLLDEPAAGLDTAESEWLGDRLRDVRAEGVTILMVDHDVNLVLSLCDHIVVLNFGELIASGTPAEIRANPLVIAAYLGSTHSQPNVPEEVTR